MSIPRTGRTSKRKGNRFELELAKYLAESLGIEVARSIYTGDPMTRKGKGNSDLIGLPDLAVEAKFVERLNFPEALNQATRNAGARERPVVVNRRSRMKTGDSYVLLRLDDFIDLYRAYGITEGFFRRKDDQDPITP